MRSTLFRLVLVILLTATSAAMATAEEPRVNGGWTDPWKLLTVEFVLYVNTVADRITLEAEHIPLHAIGMFSAGCALAILSVYLGRRLQEDDVVKFRKLRAGLRAVAQLQGVALLWIPIDLVRTRQFAWSLMGLSLLFYLVWLFFVVEIREGTGGTVRIKDAPPLIADWAWWLFASAFFAASGQLCRWWGLYLDPHLRRDLSEEKERELMLLLRGSAS